MDIDKLRYFYAIYKSGSLTEASLSVGVSQPALSKAMRSLEEQLEFELLIPSGRGVIVTDQGRRVAEKIPGILQELEALKLPKPVSKTKLSMASFEVFTTYFLGEFLSNQPSSELEIDVHELLPGALEEQVACGNVDIGISYISIPHAEIESIQVGTIAMGIYGKDISFSEVPFKDLPFVIPILPQTTVPTKVEGLDGWPEDKVKRKVIYRVGMMESALELCRRGLAVAYLPKFVVDLHNAQVITKHRLNLLNPPKLIKHMKQPVYLIKRKSMVENKMVRQIAKELRRLS